MKNFKWIMIVMIGAALVLGTGFSLWSAEKMVQPRTKTQSQMATPVAKPVQPLQVQKKCPPGWHVDQVSTFSWSCKPDPITSFECPEGYVWRWSGECTGLCESVDIPK